MSENEDQGQGGGGLRKQLEDALARIQELEGQVEQGTGAARELAFLKAGIDTESGVGKLLAKTYDGALDPEDIQAYAQEFGIEAGQQEQAPSNDGPQRQQVDPAQQRMDSLRAQSRPEGSGQRMTHKEYLALNTADPGAARIAWEAGQVDVPPHIATQLAANRAS